MLKQNCLKSKIVTLATLLNWLVSECVLFQSTVESNMKLNAEDWTLNYKVKVIRS